MLVQGARPRQLRWYHAGPMLFGDWGTSRLYVLGLAFFYTQHSSLWFMGAMSLLLIAVGWAYQVVCRLFPDGGGVYSSARQHSQTLAVIGALFLCADYSVTAAISSLDAFHYLHLPYPELWAAFSIAGIGAINYFGPTKGGWGALVVAMLTIALSLTVGMAAAPYLGHTHVEAPSGSPMQWWGQFSALILAISGVEAIANMTSIMVPPVEKTAKRAIWPVVGEIVTLNLVLTMAMLAVPVEVLGDGDASRAFIAHRDNMMRLLADYYVGPTFAAGAALVFAFLLLSAVNTAITGVVSVQFMMARDGELPKAFSGLNQWGMPMIALVLGTVVPGVLVLLVPDVAHLADLYAIGVVGAVSINLSSCSLSRDPNIKRWERIGMGAIALLLIAIWFTIAYEKPRALVFAGTITAFGLGARWVARHRSEVGGWVVARVRDVVGPQVEEGIAVPAGAPHKPSEGVRKRILVSTRGNPRLLNFAFEQARLQNAEILVLFVRHIAVPTIGPGLAADSSQDKEAQALFADVRRRATEAGVPVFCLYAVAWDIAEAILEVAATYSVDYLILGTTQRGTLWRTMKGDVLQQIGQHLPERISLLIHT